LTKVNFELPATIQRELEQYAEAEHISPTEAAVKFIRSGLEASREKSVPRELTEADWEILRNDPTIAFFRRLPDHVLEQMEAASREIHSERFIPRG
jgi:hypothetical protein